MGVGRKLKKAGKAVGKVAKKAHKVWKKELTHEQRQLVKTGLKWAGRAAATAALGPAGAAAAERGVKGAIKAGQMVHAGVKAYKQAKRASRK